MKQKLDYTPRQRKKSSNLLSLAKGELVAAYALLEKELYRESVVHMYFCCFYLARALLVREMSGKKATHRSVERNLHKISKTRRVPPSYVKLHSFLHNLRIKHSYKEFYSPPPLQLKQKFNRLCRYVKFALENIPKTTTLDILQEILDANQDLVRDFSYDVYCPKTYSRHTRITFWQPPFYLDIAPPEKICEHAKKMLSSLKVRRPTDYVLGLNSRLDQYEDIHLIMLDIDTLGVDVEKSLHAIGGVLLKSGRGLHFIGRKPICGKREWEKAMKEIRRDPVLGKYIDKSHIDMSIKRGYATLRITKSDIKPSVPIFYKELYKENGNRG